MGLIQRILRDIHNEIEEIKNNFSIELEDGFKYFFDQMKNGYVMGLEKALDIISKNKGKKK